MEVTKGDKEIVSAFRACLADKIGSDRYELWFGPSTQLELRPGHVLVSVPTTFAQDWLRKNLRKQLEAAAVEVLGQAVKVEFRVDSALAALAPAKAKPTIVAPDSAPAANAEPARPRLARRRFHTLSSFVVGPSNRLAHAAAQQAAARPGTLSPLFLHGPTGVGKTHLLEGIWSSFKQLHRHEVPLYLSAEQFTSHFLEALHGGGLPSFRRKHRGVGLLILDDVQFFVGKKATLNELLHTIDAVLREGRQLVLAADRPPSALKSLGPEILTRLGGSMCCRLEPAEYATRVGIVSNLAEKFELQLPDDVRHFVACEFTAHARELSGALMRLQATSLALAKPITLGLAQEALADLTQQSRRIVNLPDIERAVCDVLGIGVDGLQAAGKRKLHSQPRMLAMFLARKHTRAGLSEIGQFFGRRSHSTVISAHNKIGGLIARNARIELAEQSWNVDELIRRVEDRLRAS